MNLLQSAGASDAGNYAPIFTNRFFLGLHTNRNPLRDPTGVIYANFYQVGHDALIAGTNVEISNRLTLIRRPGNTAGLTNILSSANVPAIPLSFYSFHEINNNVRVFADSATSPYLITSAAVIPIVAKASGAGQSYYQGINQTLYFSDPKEQLKWQDLLSTATITNTALTTNVATITAVNDFEAGESVLIAGTSNGSGALNGVRIIASATPTAFTFSFTHADITSAPDTGTATVSEPGNSFSTITNTALTSNVATITALNSFAVGQTVEVSATTASSGALNGSWTITAASPTQFSFDFTHADIVSGADTGYANACWNWGIVAPTTAPTLTVIQSGSAAVPWKASSWYSTMGILVDSNGNAQQLVSVNANGTNPPSSDSNTQYGKSGNGAPDWGSIAYGGSITDGGVTWQNKGPLGTWAPNATFNGIGSFGTDANPAVIYDSSSGGYYWNSYNTAKISGPTKPPFNGILGSNFFDGTCNWVCFASDSNAPYRLDWSLSTFFSNPLTGGNGAVVVPQHPPTSSVTSVLFIVTTDGTSASSYSNPPWATGMGDPTVDNQLLWINLGSTTWTANTLYNGWSQPNNHNFSCILDGNNNLQVCVQTGTSGTTVPLNSWKANHSYSIGDKITDTNGNLQTVTTGGTSGVAKTLTLTDITNNIATYTTSVAHGYAVGQLVTVVSSSHNKIFNVTNAIIGSVPASNTFTVTILHQNITSAADTGTSYAGPTWATTLGNTTADGSGTLVWTNGGAASPTNNTWGTTYGSQTQDGNAKWVCVGSATYAVWTANQNYYLSKAGFSAPTPFDSLGSPDILDSNSNVEFVIQTGVSNSTVPTWNTTTTGVTPDNTVIWTDNGAVIPQSLSWTSGFSYVYAFKARTASDPLVTAIPPLGSIPLGLPTGSADGSVSTASPSAFFTGSNTGAVIDITGTGSTDPQVDTIEIYRTSDGGSIWYYLTSVPNPATVAGHAGTWHFRDYMTDTATSTTLVGLDTLTLAPVAGFNDPPPALINIVQHFGRIWGSVGATVYSSEGPLVGGASQPEGNPYTAFNLGQFWTFPSPVTRLVPTTSGLFVFTTSDLFIISGGPEITSVFSNILVPGLGLTSYNALSTQGSLIHLLTSDNQFITLDPSMGLSETGFPIGDKINSISPSSAYVAYHIQGSNDKAIYLANGSTGWYRCNPNQAPDAAISGPVWSPFATITGSCGAIASVEVKAGQHALLIGSTSANQPILVRDSTYTTFTDNGSAYTSNCTLGSLILANPGQLAEIGFITCEFINLGTSPKFLVLLDEIKDSSVSISAASFSGPNTTYTYTLTSGDQALFSGMTITITGMTTSGNNGTFVITSLGAGTFTVVNASGHTESGQSGTGTRFEDLSGYVFAATSRPPQDSPWIYGATLKPSTIFSNRYYFGQSINGTTPQPIACRHLQTRIDFGSTDTVQNELLTLTVYGKHHPEL